MVDPMAEKYYSLSSYNYVANNPIIFVDINGEGPGKIINNSSSAITLTGDGSIIKSVVTGTSVKDGVAFVTRTTTIQRGSITLNTGDVFNVENRIIGKTIVKGGVITRKDGTVENVAIQDIDFIDVQQDQTFTIGDEKITAGNEFNRKQSDGSGNDEFVPKEEVIGATKEDADYVLTPNKGEIRIKQILPDGLNGGELKFDNGDNKAIKVTENSLNLILEVKKDENK